MSDLAVIIVSWNVRELLASCLRSLQRDLKRSQLEAQVWVVDNQSADGSANMVRADFPTVRLIASEENLGFAGGNNRALAEILDSPSAVPQAVWLLNPDTEVQPGATRALYGALEQHPRAAVAGARLLYPDGRFQHSAFHFPGLGQLAFDLFPLPPRLYETRLNGRYPQQLYEGQAPFTIDHPLGAAMMVQAEAIRQVGRMDEAYRVYCEEIDWCWRMRRAGWRALCVPTAVVVHRAGQSTGQVPVSSFVNLWTSRARLYRLHHGTLTRRLARLMVRIGVRRRMRDADTEWADACRAVLRAWEAA